MLIGRPAGHDTISSMYEEVARYYDALHARLTVDIGFVLTLAGRVGGPVLECGCGTGRVLLPLARAGFQVTGIDNSPAMLDRALATLRAEKEAVHGRVHLVQADMTAIALPEQAFSLVLVSYNTFLHLDRTQQRPALASIRRHLRPGGMLFVDLPNPATIVQTPNDHMLTLEQVLADPETQDPVLVFARNHLEEQEQILHITWVYDRSPAGGGPVVRQVVQAAYHYLYLHEMELLLQEAGLQLAAVYGDYNQADFGEESERMLVLAIRRG